MFSCRNNSIELKSNGFTIPKDSLFYEEVFLGANGDQEDTLCRIRVSLTTWKSDFYVKENLGIGIQTVRQDQNGNYSYNIIYDVLDASTIKHEFEGKVEGKMVYNKNYDGVSLSGTIDRACSFGVNNNAVYLLFNGLFREDMIDGIGNMLREQRQYRRVFFRAFLSDSKNIYGMMRQIR